ncbi:MAG: hypothetical protein Kow0092_37310 [Deferrisomatales bacterium]
MSPDRRVRRTWLRAAGAVCLAAAVRAAPCPAADTGLEASLGVRAEYNDNVAFTRTDARDDLLAVVSPAVRWRYAGERYTLRPSLSADLWKYADRTELDDFQWFAGLDCAQAFTERLQGNASASYREDTTLETELEETGIVRRREDRFRFVLGTGVSYLATERSRAEISYRYSDTAFATAANEDYTSHAVTAAYTRSLNPRGDVLTLQPSYVRYDSTSSEVDNFGFTVGYTRHATETLTGRAAAGVRYTRVDQRRAFLFGPVLVVVDAEDSNWGFVADLALEYRGERTTATAGYSQDLIYSSDGEPFDRRRLYLNGTFRLTRRLVAGLGTDWNWTRSEAAGNVTGDSRYYRVGPYLSYRWTENQDLSVRYDYSYDKDEDAGGDEVATRNRVWVLWTLRYPFRS